MSLPGTKDQRVVLGVGLFAGLGALALLVISCATVERTVVAPPMIDGATFVGDKACADCHANITRAFPASPHSRLNRDSAMAGAGGCESCHGPASKHVAIGGAGREKFIVNPGKDPQACFQCHLDINAQFHLPQHHPVLEGQMNCAQCHDPHGMDIMKPAGGLAMARLNETCAQCHREQTRPFVFEHAALREGCTVCHTPHGSVNAKLLTVRDQNLCLRCHAQRRLPGHWKPLHWQRRTHILSALRHLLDRGMPRIDTRLKHATLLLLLKKGRRKFAERLAGLLFMQALGGLLVRNVQSAELDPSKLPPPAPDKIEFARDIKPIFEKSCLRCHGPEKPKSGFRLDNRAAALKGGDDGVDILPGNSAKSALVHYVARLVPDMEMPPEGKGDPLTTNQIAVLRAWIDQGAAWDNAMPTNLFDLTLAPTLGYTFTSGDKHKFREHYWRTDGIDGGLERSELFQQIDPDTSLTVAGQSRLNDYKVSLELRRNELGFIRSGWEQHRKYYDGFGGYEGGPTPHLPPAIDEDLHLDYGRVWIDFGLTLPRWPQLVLGYEYDYKHGTEAITSWQSDQVPGDSRNIAPAAKHLQEGAHVIKFDFDAELKGIAIEDRFRGEFYNLNSHYTNLAARNNFSQNVSSRDSYFEGANSIRLEKKFTTWWFGSGGYFYSKLNANDSFSDITAANNIAYIASVPRIDLERESHVFNLNSLFGPFSGLTLSAGVQSEWTRQTGVGSGNLNGIAYQPTRDFPINPATLSSDYDKNTVSESLGLRYTKIPFTTFFADARFQQEKIAQTDSDIQPAPALSFAEDTTYTSRLYDTRAGLSTSPWQSVSFSAHYRRYEDDSRYKTNDVAQPVGGYPGFISWRDLLTDEAEAKLSLRPLSWLKTMFTYQFVTTDYKQDTRTAFTLVPPATYSPGGFLLAGKYNSHIYSVGATMTPFQRLVLCGTFSYQDSKTATDSSGLVPPYKGDVYSALLSGTYILDQTTDLALSYSFSRGDYSDDRTITLTTPLPLGIKYQQHALQAALIRRISKHLTTRLQYGFYYYDEPSLAGADNYKAHTVLATLVYHFH